MKTANYGEDIFVLDVIVTGFALLVSVMFFLRTVILVGRQRYVARKDVATVVLIYAFGPASFVAMIMSTVVMCIIFEQRRETRHRQRKYE